MTPLSSMLDHELAPQIPPSAGSFAAPVTEDLLDYLLRVQPSTYRRGAVLPKQALYYVETGLVHVTAILERGESAGLGFHGCGALLCGGFRNVAITALRNDTVVMGWNSVDLTERALYRPGAQRAYVDLLAAHVEHLQARLAESRLGIEQRFAVAFLRLACGPLGTKTNDGAVKLPALTHEELCREVGTSREITTHYMNKFRRACATWYDRKGIAVYPDRLREVAKLEGIEVHV